jgi:hypothetical protein
MVEYIVKKEICGTFHSKKREAGFDVSCRDCPAKGGTGGHLNSNPTVKQTVFNKFLHTKRTQFTCKETNLVCSARLAHLP